MPPQYFDAFTLSVIFGGLAVLVVCLILRQFEAVQKTVPIWLATGLVGALLGCGATMGAVRAFGFAEPAKDKSDLAEDPAARERQASLAMVTAGPLSGGGGGGMPGGGGAGGMPGGGGGGGRGGGMGGGGGGAGGGGMGGGGMGGGGMGGGGMGGGGGMMGAAPQPQARRELTTLISKLDLLTRGVRVEVDADQASKLAAVVAALDSEMEMTEEFAKEHLEAINAILSDEQKSALGSVELARRGGGPGAGGPRGPGSGPGAAAAANSNENPFKTGDNASRLNSLLERLGKPATKDPASESR